MVRQNWIAFVGKQSPGLFSHPPHSGITAGRPGLPSGGARQAISLSSQINKDPRFFSEAL
jgi:hypothetical protein